MLDNDTMHARNVIASLYFCAVVFFGTFCAFRTNLGHLPLSGERGLGWQPPVLSRPPSTSPAFRLSTFIKRATLTNGAPSCVALFAPFGVLMRSLMPITTSKMYDVHSMSSFAHPPCLHEIDGLTSHY